jgi:hypothetical protein
MSEKNTVFKVSSVNWKGHLKRLTLQPGPHWLTLPLSSCVSTGDRVRLTDEEAWVICQNRQAQILQPYAARETLALDGLQVEAVVKEITESDEHNAYKSLAEYHYRDSVIHGRTARLIVCAFHPLFPQVLGYVELATPFYINEGSLSFDKHAVVASPHHYRRKITYRHETPCHEHGSAGCHGQSRLTSVDHGVDRASP